MRHLHKLELACHNENELSGQNNLMSAFILKDLLVDSGSIKPDETFGKITLVGENTVICLEVRANRLTKGL